MKKLKGVLKRKAEIPIQNKPHLVVKVEEKKPIPETAKEVMEKIEKFNEDEYPQSAIDEYKALGKRPYYKGELTKTFKVWYDANKA